MLMRMNLGGGWLLYHALNYFCFLKFFMIRSWKKHNQVCRSQSRSQWIVCIRLGLGLFPTQVPQGRHNSHLSRGLRTVPWALLSVPCWQMPPPSWSLPQCPLLPQALSTFQALVSSPPKAPKIFELRVCVLCARHLSVDWAWEQWCDLILDGILYLHISFWFLK